VIRVERGKPTLSRRSSCGDIVITRRIWEPPAIGWLTPLGIGSASLKIRTSVS